MTASAGTKRKKTKSSDPASLPKLPRHWRWAVLSDLASPGQDSITDGPFGSNLKTSHYTDSGPRVIRLQNIGDGVFRDEYAHISNSHFQSLKRHEVCAGDVVIAALGETLPRACVIPSWVGPAIVKADCPRFRPNPEAASAQYVAYALNSPDVRKRTSDIIHGVGRPRLNLSEIRGIWIPVAPPHEQRRIVDKIDELFSDLDAGVAALERAKANLKRYRAAVLKAAVEGKLTEEWRAEHPDVEPASKLLERILTERRQKWEADQIAKFAASGKQPPKNWKAKYVEPTPPDVDGLPELPERWCWATAEQLSDETRAITYGVVKLGDPVSNGVPTLRSSNVRSLRLELHGVKRIHQSIASGYKRTFLNGGEILFTIRGTLGGIAVATDECRGWNVSREIAVLAPVDKRISAVSAIFAASSLVQNWLSRNSRGIAYTGINIETLKELPLPLAPPEESSEIVSEIEERLSQISAAETTIAHGLRRAAQLRQSILKWAYKGLLPY